VYRERRDEIVALVGEERYAKLVAHIEATAGVTQVLPPVLKKRT
jgi:hypothetical protein